MNDIWLSYVLMGCVPIFWITNILGYSMAKRFYKKLCASPLPSIFNLTQYLKIKKCLFDLDKKDLTPSDVKHLGRLKLILKIQDISLVIIVVIAIWAFIKQGFKFV
ncbi:MAG: Unknown protein [uncultured Sulfurovum sp.]|uniref:Uncharacterized protein n=1 Tax=uncultured Sulfurovum sp. TaxID=269237 RepID=A0A6S6T2B5_9BACT|nr:MAG: Unknown protein [uncultured Sulfurovum sp.]